MNEETKENSPESQEKLTDHDDAKSEQDSDKKIEIVSEVSNLLNNLVKKVENTNESDEENPSDDENIFKTESKVNDMGKIENDTATENQNEEQKDIQNEEQKDIQNEQQEDIQNEEGTDIKNEDNVNNQNDQKETQNEIEPSNSNDENKVDIEEEEKEEEKREVGILESIITNTVNQVIDSSNNEEAADNTKGPLESIITNTVNQDIDASNNEESADNTKGPLESIIANTVNQVIDASNNEEAADNTKGSLESIIDSNVNTIVNGKVDISTETEHKEKKANIKKNIDQDKTQSDPQTEQKANNNEFTEADIQKALDDMLKKKLLPDIKIRPDVITYARRVCEEKMMNEEYDQAINIDIAIDIMFTSLEDSTNNQKQQVNENVIRRLQQTKERKEEVEKNWNDRINEQKNINSQKVLELSKSHEKEKTAFIEEWNNPQTLVAFSKPSAKLFHLRKQQKTLALVHDFEGAKILKNEADQLEKRETSENLRKAENSMKNQYLMLLDRQNREMQCLVDNSNAAIEKLEMFKLKEMNSIENTEKVLQSRLSIPNSISASSSNASVSSLSSQSIKRNKLVSSPTVIVPNVNSKSRSLNSSVLSRRARSQMASYMATNETWRLKLKMNDVSKTIRSVEPSPKNRKTTTL